VVLKGPSIKVLVISGLASSPSPPSIKVLVTLTDSAPYDQHFDRQTVGGGIRARHNLHID
jgi:hypothetical protein